MDQHLSNLAEGLEANDLKRLVHDELHIDEYKSKMGKDEDVVVVSFKVAGREPALDLVNFIEKGYDWVIDADTSPGEVNKGKYLVFVEMNRRMRVPERIIEMLGDLETLTGFKLKDWKLNIGDKMLPANEESIKNTQIK
jgi:hypothetical protein